jgi:hypothetical protein
MAAGGNPNNVTLGPGRLYYAPLGTTEPTSASAPLPSAWHVIGYTENGTSFDNAITSEDVEVAEELEPIANVQTKRTAAVVVEMAESLKSKLLLAVGGGAATTDDGTAFEFPDPDAIVGVMLVWDSDLGDVPTATNRRWVFRKAMPSGTVTRQNRKAPQKRTISATFNCVKPDLTNKAIKIFPNASGQI